MGQILNLGDLAPVADLVGAASAEQVPLAKLRALVANKHSGAVQGTLYARASSRHRLCMRSAAAPRQDL